MGMMKKRLAKERANADASVDKTTAPQASEPVVEDSAKVRGSGSGAWFGKDRAGKAPAGEDAASS